jgi:hypothetical protein
VGAEQNGLLTNMPQNVFKKHAAGIAAGRPGGLEIRTGDRTGQ